MTEEQTKVTKVIRELRDSGHAVVIFTPEEMGGADTGSMEDLLNHLGDRYG